MVRFSTVLFRVPVIKFRKGGLGHSPPPSSSQGSCSMTAAPATATQSQPASAMSTSIPDIDLPARYQRRPLSQEEIDHINGGGIV